MTLYTEIDMEPIPIHCDSAISEFTITPALPEGMTINPASGMISGRLATEESASYEYTVTATNSYGSGSTSSISARLLPLSAKSFFTSS